MLKLFLTHWSKWPTVVLWFQTDILLIKHFCFLLGLPSELSPAIEEEESKSGLDVMPNISDVLLRKLRVHKSLPGR